MTTDQKTPDDQPKLPDEALPSDTDLAVGRKPISQVILLKDPEQLHPIVQIDNGIVFLYNRYLPALIAAGRSPVNRTTADAFFATYADFRKTIQSPLYGGSLDIRDGLAINIAHLVNGIIEGESQQDITDENLGKLTLILSTFTVFFVQYRAKPSQAWTEFVRYAQNTFDYDPINY